MLRRFPQLLALILVLAFVMSACAPAAEAPAAAAPASDAAQPAAGQGGSLVIGLAVEPITLDPARSLYMPERFANMQIFDTLIAMDPEGGLHPGLATEWQANEDATEFTFTLRDDVTFHDGTALDAAAVVSAFDRIAAVTDMSSPSIALEGYASSEATDASTVVVRFELPKPRFLEDVTTPGFGIPSPAATAKDDFPQNPVGSGPFKFQEWIPQESLTLVRNEAYAWAPEFLTNPGAPLLDSVTFRFLPEQSSRLSALETGEAQVVEDPPAQESAPLVADGVYAVQSFSAPGLPSHMMLNTEKAPTDDLRVRQAMIYAVNQDELVQVAFAGLQSAAHSVLSPSTAGYNAAAAELYSFDLARAQQLLEEAGWTDGNGDGIREKDGQPLTISYPAIPAYEDAFMELLSAYLTAAGFNVEIQTMDDAGVFEYANAGSHNMVNMGWTSTDPGVLNIIYNSANIAEGSAFTRFRDERLDALLNEAAVEIDPAARNALYAEAQQIIMENALVVPVHHYDRVMLMDPAVQGWRFDAEGYPYLSEVSLAQ